MKDLFLTTLTSGFTIISAIVVISLLAQGLGPEDFGAYSLARRFVSLVVPLATLSMGIAIARYIALDIKNDGKIASYFFAGSIISITFSFLFALVCILFRDKFTLFLFHSEQWNNVFLASVFMVIGYTIYSNIYAYYRGKLEMNYANSLQIVFMAIGPILIAWWMPGRYSTAFIVFAMGLIFYLSFFPIIFEIFKSRQFISLSKSKRSFSQLLKYGLPRTPGGLAFAGLLSIGPLLAPYFGSLKDAGYFLVGQSIFRIFEGFLMAFGLIILPKMTHIKGSGNESLIGRHIENIIQFIFHIGLFVTVQIFIISPEIILVWLGPDYQDAIPIMRVLILALIPYLSYVMLRSIIDAVEKKAVNTYNLFIALSVVILFASGAYSFGKNVIYLAASVSLGMGILGVMSYSFLNNRYKLSPRLNALEVLLLNAALGFVVHTFKNLIYDVSPLISGTVYILFFQSILFFFYLWYLSRRDIKWIFEIRKRIGYE